MELVSKANKMFEGIIIMEFTNALVTGTSEIYFVINVPMSIFTNGKSNLKFAVQKY